MTDEKHLGSKSRIFCNNKNNFSKTIVSFTHNFHLSWLYGDKIHIILIPCLSSTYFLLTLNYKELVGLL